MVPRCPQYSWLTQLFRFEIKRKLKRFNGFKLNEWNTVLQQIIVIVILFLSKLIFERH